MVALLKKLWKDESGQATVEYALVIGLAAVGVIGAVIAFRTQLIELWASLTTILGDTQADFNS
jgi:pilus assembly protein Flp/PilA